MTQDALKSGDSNGFQTGTICTDSNLYKCSDDFFEVIEYVAAGQEFPNAPFGNGKGNTKWFKITLATDGDKKTFSTAKTTSSTV